MSFNKDALLHKLQDERDRYKRAYNILMEYWDSLPDHNKQEISRDLKELEL